MENLTQFDTSDVPLPRYFWDIPVKLLGRPYNAFSRRLDRQLRKLETRWAHRWASQASRVVSSPCGPSKVP